MAYKRTTTSWGNKGSKSRSTTTHHRCSNKAAGATRSTSVKLGSGNAPRVTTTTKSTRRKDGSIKNTTVRTTTSKSADGYISRKSQTISSSGTSYSKPNTTKTHNHKTKIYTSPDGYVSHNSTKSTKKTKKQQAADNAMSMALIVLLGVGAAIYYAVNYVLEVVGSFINSF